MRDIATATLSGNLTRDVELRQLPSGTDIARLRVATTTRRRAGEEWVEKTNYFTVEVYGAQARSCAQYLGKGLRVFVDAELRPAPSRGHERPAVPARLPAGGHLMTPATRTTGPRPGLFLQQLHRAAAQRGRLDPVYQELTDHRTAILQRLYPVRALIGPGLSDPGHIEIHSRTVYLDSEALLGPRAAIAAGALESRSILRTFGVALHETFHGKHTKRWAVEHDVALSESEDPADRQLAVDRRLLEEPRMEAHGVRDFPPDSLRGRFVRRALQVAVIDVILPAFAEQVLAPGAEGARPSRDLAARSTVYLQARTHYGIVEDSVLESLRAVWEAVLGASDLEALDELYAKVIWIPDGDIARLDAAARAYREIVGEPEASDGDGPGNDSSATGSDEEAAQPGGRAARQQRKGRWPGRSPTRSSRRSRTPAAPSSISSTRTSTSNRSSATLLRTATVRPSSAADAGPGYRRGECPTEASTARRSRTRCSTPAATPTGCGRRSPVERGRSTSAPQAGASTAAPTPAAAPSTPADDRSAPTRGGLPGRSPCRSRNRTSG
jgi:Single-strand binding protein family